MANRVVVTDRPWRGPAGSIPLGRALDRARRLLEEEALPLLIVFGWIALLFISMPVLLVSDSWLSLVDGRYVIQHGLPNVDTLMLWTSGHAWTDQQWGAHVLLYGAAAHGGLRLAVAIGIACVAGALLVALAVGRSLGGSARSRTIGLAVALLGAPWLAQVRSQSFALPLFVAVYGLLALDSRRPSRRVLCVFPLLVLWANLHGSVALGAGLVALYGLTLVRNRPTRLRGLALCAAPLTLLASPYGFSLVGYYRLMLLHPPFVKYVVEWQSMSVTKVTVMFFLSAFVLAALWGGHRRRLTTFEQWSLVVLVVVALAAVRNAVWFELAAAVSLPRLLDAAWPSRIELTAGVRRLNLVLASAALVAVAAVGIVHLARGSTWLERDQPKADAAIVARAAGPDGIVLANSHDADWLLWHQPSLAGRIAYDVRFELLSAKQLEHLALLVGASHPIWKRCGSIARVVTFHGAADEKTALREGVLGPDRRTIIRAPKFVAVQQQPTAAVAGCRRL